MIEDLFKNKKVKRIFGTAGSGKTTRLIEIIEELLLNDVKPEEICFCSFTNKAVDEMVERISKKFENIDRECFKFFRTIHSLCFSLSNNKRMMTQKDLQKIAKKEGLEVSNYNSIEEGAGSKKGDRVVAIENLSRLKMTDLYTAWKNNNFNDIEFFRVEDWQKRLMKFKSENNLSDFTDLLQNFNKVPLPVKYMIVDEAQDLSPLQWKALDIMSKNCELIVVAGDDDQAIYNWAGADVNYILNIKSDEDEILSTSHRMPKNIYKLSREILNRIENRREKEGEQKERKGCVKTMPSFESISFKKNEEYLILVRNRFQANYIIENLERSGLHFSYFGISSIANKETTAIKIWEKYRKTKVISMGEWDKCKIFSSKLHGIKYECKDNKFLNFKWFDVFDLMEKRFYYRELLKRGVKFSDDPKIKVSTIHQAKGGEADNVILLTDVSGNTLRNINDDSEHRVWYVAVSRTKNNLYIIREQSNKFYRIN
jgi:DNA helicase-2/ATP-dependent DNA helicase PcrA